jgi:hypothetical protein
VAESGHRLRDHGAIASAELEQGEAQGRSVPSSLGGVGIWTPPDSATIVIGSNVIASPIDHQVEYKVHLSQPVRGERRGLK